MIESVTYHLAAYETPLWAMPNGDAGRFNQPGDGSTQYLCLHPLTPWAELLRVQERRTRAQALEMRLPVRAIRVLVDDHPVDLDFDTAEDFGLEPGDLLADDHLPCRELARRWREDPQAPTTFVTPSAALPGTRNLVVLEPRVAIPYQAEPLDSVDVPLSLAAEGARCPNGLVEQVHHHGSPTPHAGLAAWQQGEELVFTEPSVTPSTA